MNSSVLKIGSFMIFLLCFLSPMVGDARELDYGVHANIIYRFTKYIDWPEHTKTGNFVIGVIGETPLYDELVALTKNKSVGKQDIVIRYFSPDARTYNAHIIFVSEEESSHLRRVVDVTEGKPVLILTERSGMISKGACINLVIVSDHLKLEFGKTNIERRNLKIASELLKLGTIIN